MLAFNTFVYVKKFGVWIPLRDQVLAPGLLNADKIHDVVR